MVEVVAEVGFGVQGTVNHKACRRRKVGGCEVLGALVGRERVRMVPELENGRLEGRGLLRVVRMRLDRVRCRGRGRGLGMSELALGCAAGSGAQGTRNHKACQRRDVGGSGNVTLRLGLRLWLRLALVFKEP